VFLCHSQTENKGVNNMEKCYLNLSLLFYPSTSTGGVVYSINIVNDSLTIKTNWRAGNKEYKGKLTNNQCLEIKNMISALTQKYDWSGRFALGSWGCMLKVDNQVYYEDNYFSFDSTRFERRGLRSTPEEIKQLIDYIVGLSPIPIILFSFS
jgi:hypothetical protein